MPAIVVDDRQSVVGIAAEVAVAPRRVQWGFGIPPDLQIGYLEDREFDPVPVLVHDPLTDTALELTVIGVLSDNGPMAMAGITASQQVLAPFGDRDLPTIHHPAVRDKPTASRRSAYARLVEEARTVGEGTLDRRGLTWGLIAVAIVVALTFIGSDQLVWFDAALVGYLFGTIFAVFGVTYRYAVWLRRPPTAMLNRRGWDAFRARKVRNAAALPALVGTQLLAQTFILRRSRTRWLAHQLIFWGCVLAALITFPLTLGLLHFQSVGQQADRYRVYVSRVGTSTFDADSVVGWIIFHGLDIAAVLVLAGVFIFLRRRLRDPGALAVERSGDFLALAGLFAVSVTGLFLTVSSTWLDGQFYAALNTIHALTVILGLMYLPFGKLFHIFQRPGNLGVAYYKAANAEGPAAVCRRCGAGFASAQQVADLQKVLPQVGFDYGIDGGGNYQDTCPACRRASVTLAQSARVGGFG